MAQQRLEAVSVDNSADKEAFRQDLLNIARTTLSSKILTHDKDHFAAPGCGCGACASRAAPTWSPSTIIKKPVLVHSGIDKVDAAQALPQCSYC